MQVPIKENRWATEQAVAQLRVRCLAFLLVASVASCSHLPDMNEAAVTGDLDSLREHVRRGTSVDVRDEAGYTPLLWAAMAGNEEAALFLLDHGADPNARVMERVGTLGENGVCETTEPGPSVLHYASAVGNVPMVKLLLEKGADVAVKAGFMYRDVTPLYWASSGPVAELLLAAGADPRATTKYGETPLHEAAANGHSDVVELLIEKKVQVDARDRREQTPLMVAAGRGHSGIVEVLLKRGADISATDLSCDTALHRAVCELRCEAARVLLEHRAAPSAVGNHGDTPLHIAAGGTEFDYGEDVPAMDRPPDQTRGRLVQLLLAHKAEVNARGGGRRSTPLHRAAYKGYAEAIKALIAGGAHVNARTSSTRFPLFVGWEETTPLHWAVDYDRTEAVRLLLEAGADAKAKDKNGTTPLELARSDEVKKLLMKYEARR